MTTDVNQQREEEFNKAMAALYNEKPQDEPTPSPVESPSSPPVESPTDAPESTPEAAEPAKAPTPTPADDTPPESVPDAPTEPEVDLQAEWAKLHPKVKQAIEQERRASQSAVGRVAFLNRELDKLKNEIGRKPQPQEHLPKANETPAEKKLRLEKLEKLRETDRDYAETIDEVLLELDRRHVEEVGKWQQQVSPLQQQAKELELRLEEQTMDMHAPDWREAVTSQAFQEWQQLKLPPDERAALGTYSRAKDLLPYINAFKQDWQAYQAAYQPQAPAAVSPPQADTTTADKVAQDRNRKLQQPAVGPSSVPKPNARPVDLSDPETRRKEFERYSASLYST